LSANEIWKVETFDAPAEALTASVEARREARAAVMQRAHREKLRLCSVLEEIADSLPDRVDPLMCLSTANTLLPMLRNIHRYEEDTIFPAYAAATDDTGGVERLKAEHLEDECFADELTEALLRAGHCGTAANPEALGFMLRGFFETIRRHVAFEREHILPAIATARGPDRTS
jgi:hemerythrin-like domain-containing protein